MVHSKKVSCNRLIKLFLSFSIILFVENSACKRIFQKAHQDLSGYQRKCFFDVDLSDFAKNESFKALFLSSQSRRQITNQCILT